MLMSEEERSGEKGCYREKQMDRDKMSLNYQLYQHHPYHLLLKGQSAIVTPILGLRVH
jgi:hypothetical protein